MTKILIDKAVIEQALEALSNTGTQRGREPQQFHAEGKSIEALHSALEQPQGEQEPVAVIGDVWTLNWVGSDPIATIVKKHGLKIGDKLYTHPQNLNCKSTQHRLATLWGYEKPQPPRQPLTDDEIRAIGGEYEENTFDDGWSFQFARMIEAAHGIGESNA